MPNISQRGVDMPVPQFGNLPRWLMLPNREVFMSIT